MADPVDPVVWKSPYPSHLMGVRLVAHPRSAVAFFGAQPFARVLVDDVRADIFCYSCTPSATPPALLESTTKRAEELGIVIGIDHYDWSDDDEVSSLPPQR